jgi:hypothetical protein
MNIIKSIAFLLIIYVAECITIPKHDECGKYPRGLCKDPCGKMVCPEGTKCIAEYTNVDGNFRLIAECQGTTQMLNQIYQFFPKIFLQFPNSSMAQRKI